MHEMSICESLLSQVTAIAAEHQSEQVTRIIVRLGPLSNVEAELLLHAFTIAREGTVAYQAELVIESSSIRVRCQTCGAESEVKPNCLLCGVCGDWHTQLLSGDEMLLASVELIKPN